MLTLTLESDTTNKRAFKEKTPLQLALARFGHNKVAIGGLILLLFFIATAILAPVLTRYNPIKPNITKETRLQAPSAEHWLGTDALGRDAYTRLVYGGRLSLWIGLGSVLLSLAVGVPLGLISGYSGGILDTIIMRIMDLILSFPGLIFAIWLVSMLGPGVNQVILAIAFWSLPEYSRVVRGSVLSIKQIDYIQAARALGSNYITILFKHILPNVVAPIIIISSLSVSAAILTGASLSFLGLGSRPPTPEWGLLLADGRPYIRQAWWLNVFPGLVLTLVVISSNIFGDGLRDALDPRASTKGR
jgi:peptide/nickel transport system permease protein